MNSDELKQLQAPLKSQYREKPDSAMVTLKRNPIWVKE